MVTFTVEDIVRDGSPTEAGGYVSRNGCICKVIMTGILRIYPRSMLCLARIERVV